LIAAWPNIVDLNLRAAFGRLFFSPIPHPFVEVRASKNATPAFVRETVAQLQVSYKARDRQAGPTRLRS
jgi:hypothetical protein